VHPWHGGQNSNHSRKSENHYYSTIFALSDSKWSILRTKNASLVVRIQTTLGNLKITTTFALSDRKWTIKKIDTKLTTLLLGDASTWSRLMGSGSPPFDISNANSESDQLVKSNSRSQKQNQEHQIQLQLRAAETKEGQEGSGGDSGENGNSVFFIFQVS
jgi:hypothetical protein